MSRFSPAFDPRIMPQAPPPVPRVDAILLISVHRVVQPLTAPTCRKREFSMLPKVVGLPLVQKGPPRPHPPLLCGGAPWGPGPRLILPKIKIHHTAMEIPPGLNSKNISDQVPLPCRFRRIPFKTRTASETFLPSQVPKRMKIALRGRPARALTIFQQQLLPSTPRAASNPLFPRNLANATKTPAPRRKVRDLILNPLSRLCFPGPGTRESTNVGRRSRNPTGWFPEWFFSAIGPRFFYPSKPHPATGFSDEACGLFVFYKQTTPKPI